MWSDTLLRAEQLHLLRLVLWGAGSVLAGGVLLLVLAVRRTRSPLLMHFAVQTVAWGAVSLAMAGYRWSGLGLRDHASAVRLDRVLWLNIGLEAGYVGVGATLAIVGWVLGRRLAPVGAGLAIMLQGLALALLDLQLVSHLSR